MDLPEPYVLIAYINLEDLRNLCLVNSYWYHWTKEHLPDLAYYYELPIFTTFSELYQSYFWSSNRLLDYAKRIDDERLKTIAFARYAVDDVKLEPFSARNIESIPTLRDYLQKDRKARKYRLGEFSSTFIYKKDYELAIYIFQTYKHKQDLWYRSEFRKFCMQRGLTDVLCCMVQPYYVEVLMKDTGCTEGEVRKALVQTNGNLADY